MTTNFVKILPKVKEISSLRFLILDIDGVMTEGTIGYTDNGDQLKFFDAKDGAGLKYWARAGHRAGIISGRTSPTILRRAEELDIKHIAMKAVDKLPAAEKMLAEAGVEFSETIVIGDDLPDIPLLRRAGLGVAVADAVPEVRDAALYVTNKCGGKGAVREVIETVLAAQGKWDDILKRYYV